jgi:hypothetical protein
MTGASASGNLVQGNFLGMNDSGTAALSNQWDGVSIDNGAKNNVIGGTTTAARNVIAGNMGRGVFVDGSASTGNVIQGNYIGTAADGTTQIGNYQEGVYVKSPGATIGGTAAGAGNVITYSGRVGASVNAQVEAWGGSGRRSDQRRHADPGQFHLRQHRDGDRSQQDRRERRQQRQ